MMKEGGDILVAYNIPSPNMQTNEAFTRRLTCRCLWLLVEKIVQF